VWRWRLMVAISLASATAWAERDADKQRTVALVTCTGILGLAAPLAVVYGMPLHQGLIPAVLPRTICYTLVSILSHVVSPLKPAAVIGATAPELHTRNVIEQTPLPNSRPVQRGK